MSQRRVPRRVGRSVQPLALSGLTLALAACGSRAPVPPVGAADLQAQAVSSGSVYYLRNACGDQNRVLTVAGGSLKDNAAVQISGAANVTHQQWRLERYPADGSYVLISVKSGKALDVVGASKADGAGVAQWGIHRGTNQRWFITELGNGFAKLNPAHVRTKALDVPGGSTADGTPVQLHTDNGTCAQQWKLEPVGSGGGSGTGDPGTGGGTVSPGKITLPVEVIGGDGYTTSVDFEVGDPTGVSTLYLRGHRLGYRDGSVNDRAKISVRLNGGAWTGLTNSTATLFPLEKAYGGIGGGMYTTRLTVPVSGVKAGRNTLEFRFNGTDGFTSGARITELNLLRGGARVLPESAFVQDDPRTWTAPLPGAADIAEGDRLWHEAELLERPGGPAISVSCAGCHASAENPGAGAVNDLKYYNFSNGSITARSQFHGLSDVQAKQVASYVRAFQLRKPDGAVYLPPAKARPWNPPYQPAPGLDSLPVEEWAAGGGVDAVLEKDSDMLPFLFPGGTGQAEMDRVASTKGTLNMRELPITIQLPDILAWWPEIHPQDIWGDSFNTGHRSPVPDLKRINDTFRAQRPETVTGYPSAPELLGWFGANGTDLFMFDSDSPGVNRLPATVAREDAAQAVRQWTATRLWEVHHLYNLHSMAPRFYPAGERGWIGRARTVFNIAPHISAANGNNFRYQTQKVGKYFSTSWYHLQVVVNPGYRDNLVHIPVDWKYHLEHIDNLSLWFPETPGEGVRSAASLIKDMQMWDNGYGVGKDANRGWNLREVKLEHLVAPLYAKMNASMTPDVQRGVVEAIFRTWLQKSLSQPVSEYQRWTWNGDGTPNANPGDYRWPPADLAFPAQQSAKDKGLDEYPNRLRDAIRYARPLGVNGDLLNQMADFGEAMWPRWDFETLKQP